MFRIEGKYDIVATKGAGSAHISSLPEELIGIVCRILERSGSHHSLFALALTCKAIGQIVANHWSQFKILDNFFCYLHGAKQGEGSLETRGEITINPVVTRSAIGRGPPILVLGTEGVGGRRFYSINMMSPEIVIVDPHSNTHPLILFEPPKTQQEESCWTCLSLPQQKVALIYFSYVLIGQFTNKGLNVLSKIVYPMNYYFQMPVDIYFDAKTHKIVFAGGALGHNLHLSLKEQKFNVGQGTSSEEVPALEASSLSHDLPILAPLGNTLERAMVDPFGHKVILPEPKISASVRVVRNMKWTVDARKKFLHVSLTKTGKRWLIRPLGKMKYFEFRLSGDYLLLFDDGSENSDGAQLVVMHLPTKQILLEGIPPALSGSEHCLCDIFFIKKEQGLTLGVITQTVLKEEKKVEKTKFHFSELKLDKIENEEVPKPMRIPSCRFSSRRLFAIQPKKSKWNTVGKILAVIGTLTTLAGGATFIALIAASSPYAACFSVLVVGTATGLTQIVIGGILIARHRSRPAVLFET